MKRALIVDDHVSIREMLKMVFTRERIVNVVGESGSGLKVVEMCAQTHAEIVILDLILPDLCGIEVLSRVRRDVPSARVLIYSGTLNPQLVRRCLHYRPHGYVEKSDPLSTLEQAVRTVASGGCYFTPLASKYLYDTVLGEEMLPRLTDREAEVLQMVAESRTTKEIAAVLKLSPKTVERHRSNIMDKVGARDVAALTRYAVRTGLISL